MPDFTLWAYVLVWVVAMTLIACWHRDIPRRAVPPTRRRIDSDRHTLTLVGADGRVNPARYQIFADYPAALTHQRRLIRLGQASVVTHTDSGEVRNDYPSMLGPFGRIYY